MSLRDIPSSKMHGSILGLLLALAYLCAAEKNYDGWSLVKVRPRTTEHVQYLNSLLEKVKPTSREKEDTELQVWMHGNLKRPYDIFLSPEARGPFLARLDELGITYTVTSENFKRALDKEKLPLSPRSRSLVDVENAAWFTKFLKLEEINAAIQKLAKDYPTLVKVTSIGTTHGGRPIHLVTLSSNTGKTKPAIWLDGGIHPREWASPATVLYILNKLATGYKTDATIKNYVDNATWYIVPVLNPDGYFETHTGDRMWRKNRRPKTGSSWGDSCDGVDLNRNFGYGFGGAGTSDDGCDETFRGTAAFSEPESRAVRDFVLGHKDIKAFLTIHAYSQMWFYPYGDKENSYPADVKQLEAVAQAGAKALYAVHGTRYEVGTAANLIYEAAGGSDDWAKGVAGIKYVYCLELRPDGDSAGNGFVLPVKDIVPTAKETWAGLSVVADAVIKEK